MSALATAGAGFLLAVLWMDLMFDVQVLRHRRDAGELPEPVLASIAAYYRRVTTDASPMGRAVSLVMLALLAALVGEWSSGARPAWLSLASLAARARADRARRAARGARRRAPGLAPRSARRAEPPRARDLPRPSSVSCVDRRAARAEVRRMTSDLRRRHARTR